MKSECKEYTKNSALVAGVEDIRSGSTQYQLDGVKTVCGIFQGIIFLVNDSWFGCPNQPGGDLFIENQRMEKFGRVAIIWMIS